MRAILQHCSGGRETSFPVGSQIIREGETARRLYVLVDGQLEVVKDGTVVANVAEPGSLVGEMSVLLGQPHTATVRAVSATRLYEFDDAATFLASQPSVAMLVAKTLAQRLYSATTNLADMRTCGGFFSRCATSNLVGVRRRLMIVDDRSALVCTIG
jgi:CRP/FNR family transcriptional regulator, cyclic AMP receptor protein